jgi:broad specificity phosphatase PhoE
MPDLVLIRHAAPAIAPGAYARDWPLSTEGRAQAAALAENLTSYQPSTMVSSDERKAVETADIIAERVRVPVKIVPGLQEHDRRGAGLLGREAFEAAIARFFAHPTELVIGRESAQEASERFWRAVSGVIAHADVKRDILLVTHGTVLSLLAARTAGVDAFTLWRGLRLPDALAFALPDLRLVPVRGMTAGG